MKGNTVKISRVFLLRFWRKYTVAGIGKKAYNTITWLFKIQKGEKHGIYEKAESSRYY